MKAGTKQRSAHPYALLRGALENAAINPPPHRRDGAAPTIQR